MATTHWEDGGVTWRSGAWSLERRDDELAELSYQGRRVLRSVRAVVRDGDWNTAGWIIGAPQKPGPGQLRLPLRSSGFGSDIRGELLVTARENTLNVEFIGRSHGTFATNRTGLIVLHHADLAGTSLTVRHSNDRSAVTAFPRAIKPHQPVFDIAGLSWVDDGLEVAIDFTGDTFEMEDQRNWTDASFKTYNRPLALPFPYTLNDGEEVRQSLAIRVSSSSGALNAPNAPNAPIPTRINLRAGGTFPAIGVAASESPDPSPQRSTPPGAELLVELDLRTPNWRAALRRAADRGLPLDVRVVMDSADPPQIDAVATDLVGLNITRIAVFHDALHVSDAASVESLRLHLRASGIDVPVFGGSRSHFTELNRELRRLPKDLDGVATTVTPLFHSVSSAQLIESVALQRLVAEQTVSYAGNRPVWIGPIALRPRFNNVATRPQPMPTLSDISEGTGAEFTGAVDSRQPTPELAAWTIASAAALAVPGVAGITYFEEWGPRGIRDAQGNPYPVAEAISALSALAGRALLSGLSPDGLVWAVGAGEASDTRVLAANLDVRTRELAVWLPQATTPLQITLGPRSWVQL